MCMQQYAASFHCMVEQWKDCEELKPQPKEKWIFVERKRSIEQSGMRKQIGIDVCMRCGRGSTWMKIPGRGTGPKFLSQRLEKW